MLVFRYLNIKEFLLWPSSKESATGFKKCESYEKDRGLKGLSYAHNYDQNQECDAKKYKWTLLTEYLPYIIENWKPMYDFFYWGRGGWGHVSYIKSACADHPFISVIIFFNFSNVKGWQSMTKCMHHS